VRGDLGLGELAHGRPHELGVGGVATMLASVSGTSPQDMVAIAAERIADGRIDAALVLGGEARWTHRKLKRSGQEPTWMTAPGDTDPEPLGGFPMEIRDETMRFNGAPGVYALFEDRLRVVRGATVDAHRTHIAALWEGFSRVAEANPYAWDRSVHDARSIREPSAQNRMIAFPYTKAMVANNTVDMSTAILLAADDVARAAGADADRFVYPQAIAHSRETWLVAERRDLDGSPALAAAADAAFTHAGLILDDIDHVDLYACFPSMVEMSAAALGLRIDRPLTITGGLGFCGAPIGNSVGHSIVSMVERVRDGGRGLVHGNGGSATKQSFGIYSAEPPAEYARIDVQDSIDLQPRDTLPEAWGGEAEIEAATVLYGRDGPETTIAAVLDAGGRRGFFTSADTDVATAVETNGIAGHRVRCNDGAFELVVR
jgi:acetyl-CoA C-acetyltransferase